MAVDNAVIRILHQAGMRRTGPRQAVLENLLGSDVALSHTELEQRLVNNVDRVTIYRILAAFEDQGIVHRILDPEGHPLYALCKEACDSEHHHDDHVHFHCTLCGDTYCLENVGLPSMHLPAGFKLSELSISARGCCPKCTAQAD
jgi:Fur family ferric uptake transcriptional regulator